MAQKLLAGGALCSRCPVCYGPKGGCPMEGGGEREQGRGIGEQERGRTTATSGVCAQIGILRPRAQRGAQGRRGLHFNCEQSAWSAGPAGFLAGASASFHVRQRAPGWLAGSRGLGAGAATHAGRPVAARGGEQSRVAGWRLPSVMTHSPHPLLAPARARSPGRLLK